MIKDNFNFVEKKIEEACIKSNREMSKVTLIAVSKTKPVEMIQEAYQCGCRNFGENKVQELVDKYELLPKDIKWHMIGHLQTNKVKYIIDKVAYIHSVDSYRLAEVISKEAIKKNVNVNILIEVNIADEISKFGVKKEKAMNFIEKVSELPNLSIAGLMAIAPNVENGEYNRQYFVKLHDLAVDTMKKNIDNVSMNALSMGMTGDYEIAVEEGSTFVRIGTGIFGDRQYSI
ncbi:MAG TPA: YggS family pyridoxal phosphate-dependent enzyme [Lachnospiraceae bacterium]|nr:YggS family pyridoxal phosphate-dependent enzyme [Lachnospiraceae bacterium]